MNTIDEADRRILRAMQENCAPTTAELAELVGLSPPACWRRRTRLYARVKLSNVGRANLAGFADAIRALPEVVECHVLMGAADFLLKILTKDIHAYERFFFDSLSSIAGIQDITSSVALSEIKTSHGLPI